MTQHVNNLIIGQGFAGSAVAWSMWRREMSFVIADRGEPATASRVAAGLMTPVTGKRRITPPDFVDHWAIAVDLYEFAEQQTGASFLDRAPMILLFKNEDARRQFLKQDRSRDGVTCNEWRQPLQAGRDELSGVSIKPAGRLHAKTYLDASRRFFAEQNRFIRADVDCEDLVVRDGKVAVAALNLTADRVIFCQGAAQSNFFSSIPNNPSRGDILKLQIPNYQIKEVVHGSLWIAPDSDETHFVGATYDWKNLSSEPSAQGRDELLKKLGRMVDDKVTVVDHLAGVRPTMKDYQPVVGRHSENDCVFILNGLGSKGTLRAPAMADHLLNLIENGVAVPHAVSTERLRRRTPDGRAKPLTVLAQEIIRSVLREGDAVIDGTVGNGFDTVFLAEAVGAHGRVIGFDVQQDAIKSTRQRLAAKSITNVDLRLESHRNICRFEANRYSAVMFNLGYLPKGDHSVITQPDSSEAAIEAAIRVLTPSGILTVLSYRGHDGGPQEFEAVRRLLHRYSNRYHLQTIESTPARPTSPVLFVLHKNDV